ncbi:unnamed protein product [Calypogeia fissa]
MVQHSSNLPPVPGGNDALQLAARTTGWGTWCGGPFQRDSAHQMGLLPVKRFGGPTRSRVTWPFTGKVHGPGPKGLGVATLTGSCKAPVEAPCCAEDDRLTEVTPGRGPGRADSMTGYTGRAWQGERVFLPVGKLFVDGMMRSYGQR